MANYNTLKSQIVSKVYSNLQEAITGNILQGVLLDMIDNIPGTGYIWKGVVTPSSTISTEDGRVFYLAFTQGSYTAGSLTLGEGEFGVIYYDTTWHSAKFATKTNAQINALIAAALQNYYTSAQTDSAIAAEAALRTAADTALGTRIDNLSALGRFLSVWDCTTGLPATNPTTSPYTYKTGDWYLVGKVGTTNYKPSGASYTTGVPSTTVESGSVKDNDVYRFDGSVWSLLPVQSREIAWGTIVGNLASQTDLAAALASKYVKPTSGIPKTDLASGVQTSLEKADTALQSVPNTYRTAAAQDVIDNGKQATLVSGTNIKTINGQSVLGSGNLDVGSDIEVKQTTGQSTTAVMSQKAVTDELDELRADLDAIDVDNIGDARAKSIDLDELPKVCGYQMFIFGTAVPTVTPDFIGQFFIDTTNQKVYCATGVANASSFKALN